MPTHKDFKRLVRGRMKKTGESYTTARAQLLKHPTRQPKPRAGYAKLAGMMSDAALKAKTGCTWERWVHALDRVQAYAWPHRRIAEYVHTKYRTPDWWSQTVTVGYERIKGLRAVGQRRDGGFETSKSRTFAVSLTQLYRAFSDARTRARWLPDVQLHVRTARVNKSMRVSWPDRTSVEIGFLGKGVAKSQVAVQHSKLPDHSTALRLKAYWTERLGALGEVLASR